MTRPARLLPALGLLALIAAPRPARAHEDHQRYRVDAPSTAPTRGAADPLVTLVIFSDLQCPYCARMVEVLDALVERYPDDLRIVFRHLPLPFHPQAMHAARAAECAHRQQRFWPMHDRIFERRTELESADLNAWAAELGADPAAFEACMSDPTSLQVVRDDIATARDLDVRGTPTVFVNGTKMVGARPVDDFAALVDEELALAREKVAAGTPRQSVYAETVRDGQIRTPLAPVALDVPLEGSPRLGPETAGVEVVVFSDFQCPYCRLAAGQLRDFQAAEPERRAVIFKQLPLPQHEDARAAARAAFCAGEQGRFWAMHDALFDAQEELPRAPWRDIAARLGLDPERLRRCMSSSRPDARIDADIATADALRVRATPTIFINGHQLLSGGDVEALTDAVRRHLVGEPGERGRNGKRRNAGP
ncbi:MAG: thioredoxin domain-containing protein [Deltaproteobacteria bacterium]|nr:thioredoxin domain-containing protein [Deltaproteobacteria bacterium]